MNLPYYRLLRWPALGMALFICAAFAAPPTSNNGKMLQVMHTRYGDEGAAMFTAWKTLIKKNQPTTQDIQVEAVNNFFNYHIQFREDIDLWQKNDYWATPLETLGRKAADGEDFSLAKYVTLLMIGIPANQLRLTYVKAQTSDTSRTHVVLAFYPELHATPLILDNLNPQLLSADQRPDLQPIFSVNTEGLYPKEERHYQTSTTDQFSPWRELLTRMHQEGVH